jgi:hypothetical protein
MLLINWKFMHTFLGNFTTKSIYKSYLPNTYKTTSKTKYLTIILIKYIFYYHKLKKKYFYINHTSNHSPKHK